MDYSLLDMDSETGLFEVSNYILMLLMKIYCINSGLKVASEMDNHIHFKLIF